MVKQSSPSNDKAILDDDVMKVLTCINKDPTHEDFKRVVYFFHKHLNDVKLYEWLQTDNPDYIKNETFSKTKFIFENAKYDKATITLSTLHEIASQQNPEVYEKTFDMTYRLMMSVLTDFKVAELIHHLYNKEFVYCNAQKASEWFHFDKHRWQRDDKGLMMSKYIAVNIVSLYEEKKKRYTNIKVQEFFNTFIKKIQMNKNKKTFIQESQILFNTPLKWYETLDENKFLIGFNNGIYDLKNNVFRDGKPEDMITKTVGYDYTPNINKKIRQKIMKYFYDVLPELSAEFLLKMSAYTISGNRYLEWVIFLIGTGGNGKGLYKNLMSKTMGEYGYEPSVAILTTTIKSSSSASPEKANLKSMRVAICEEAEDDKDTSLKVGYIKELSGGGKIQARQLHSNTIEFLPQFQLFLLMNNPVKLNTYDGGIERRLKNIEFPYKFCQNPQLEHEKLIDFTLKNEFDNNTEYHQQFILILLEYYYKFIHGNQPVDTPDLIDKFTKEYLGECNIVKNYLYENYDVTNKPSDKVKYSDVFNAFKIDNKGIDKTKFSNQLKINGFKITGDTTYKGERGKFIEGIKYQEAQDDDDEKEAIPTTKKKNVNVPTFNAIF